MTPTGAPVAPRTLRDLLASASASLGAGSEARWLVAHAAGLRVGDLVARLDRAAPPAVGDCVREMVDRRKAGEPLQYVLGTWEFRTLDVHVDRRALIPRPETEIVVGVALDELTEQSDRVAPDASLLAVDLGTGSGAIALSLAAEFTTSGPEFEVWATDVSPGALEVFAQNLGALAVVNPGAAARVRVAPGSWFDAVPASLAGRVRLVVSNPPYVSEAEWKSLDPTVRDHEPAVALVPGPTGLEAIEALLVDAPRWLAPGGSLVVELAPGQAVSVRARAEELGYVRPVICADLGHRPRVLVARSSGG
jgi:release factor glutamine methyltransferase